MTNDKLSSGNKYKDKRQDFFRNFFSQALSYEDFLASADSHYSSSLYSAKWKSYEQQLSLSSAQVETLQSFKRQINALVLAGAWCGDCARQGAMFKILALNCPQLNFRFIDNRSNPELQEELRINGAEKVPVVVSLSEDFFELNRFGDRHLSVYRGKLSRELGAACDPGIFTPQAELAEELGEWISHFERLQAILRLSPLLRARYAD